MCWFTDVDAGVLSDHFSDSFIALESLFVRLRTSDGQPENYSPGRFGSSKIDRFQDS